MEPLREISVFGTVKLLKLQRTSDLRKMNVKQDLCKLASSLARYSELVKVRWDRLFLCQGNPPETSTIFNNF